MKITDSTMILQSSHSLIVTEVTRESLQVWRNGDESSTKEEAENSTGRLRRRAMALLRHPPAGSAKRAEKTEKTVPGQAVADGEASLDKMHSLEVSLLKLLVERFIGREIKVVTPEELKQVDTESDPPTAPQATRDAPTGEGWGMVYQNYQSHTESEQTGFQAQGLVKTADGREVTIDIQLNMSRSFFSEVSTTLRAGDALKDPLVVNFSGSAAELTRERYEFDIDADGTGDQISFVSPGSGFLALDRNRDGTVNDGSELFGALTGDGFAELAGYDSDGNGWIDENDPVFDSLRIWSKDAEGRDQLIGLGASGIGAIYLGHVTTPFELKNQDNQLLGAVRDSGLFLGEEGGAGTIQHVDLVV